MDRSTGANKFTLNHGYPAPHHDYLFRIILDCSNKIIVTISTGKTTKNKLIVWDYNNGKKLITFLPQIEKKPSKGIYSVKIMNDRILTGGREGHLIVMRIERNEKDEPNGIMIENIINDEGKLIHEVDAHDNIPITFTEKTIKTWNIKEGTCINIIRIQYIGHAYIGAMARLPHIIAITTYGTHVWSIQKGNKVATLCERQLQYFVNITADDERVALAEDRKQEGVFCIDLWTWDNINMGIQMNDHRGECKNIKPERMLRLSNCRIPRILLTNTCLYLVEMHQYNIQTNTDTYSLKTIDFWMEKNFTRKSDVYVHRALDRRLQFLSFKDNLALDIQPS